MAIEITGKQFNPKTIRRFVQKQFEKQGLVFTDKDPQMPKRLSREGGMSLAIVTFPLKSGLKLRLGVKFKVIQGKILPESKGLVYSAKLGSTMIPLAKPKGQDYDWSSWIKKISEFVKEKEKNLKPKAPTISKGIATDNKIPNTFADKLEAKKSERDEKKAEVVKQQKSIDDQTVENTKMESEIEGFKKTASTPGTSQETTTSAEKPSKPKWESVEEMTKESLIAAGGKFWEKDNMQRVYLNKKVFEKMGIKFTDNPKWGNETKGFGQAKVWYDVKKKTLHSDVGMTRVFLNRMGFTAGK